MNAPTDSPAYARGDNQLVLYDTPDPDSTLNQKYQSITYHLVSEDIAMGK